MKPIPNFLSVFEQKLEKLKDKIKEEIHKPKKERSKKVLKEFLHEAKDLKHLINSINEQYEKRCPHCGGKL